VREVELEDAIDRTETRAMMSAVIVVAVAVIVLRMIVILIITPTLALVEVVVAIKPLVLKKEREVRLCMYTMPQVTRAY